MNIKQQIVETNVDELKQFLGCENDYAFFRFAHSTYTDIGLNSYDDTDFVDGGQDKQIDSITIEEEGDECFVYIIQSKFTDSFESNRVIQISNGLNWLFNKTREDIDKISNIKFRDKILEYRATQSSFGPSNIHIKVAYITNSIGVEVSEECVQERKTIIEAYDNDTFASFSFEFVSSIQLVDKLNASEKRNKKIDCDIKIKYDANSPSLIKYQTQGLTGIICTVPASEIARIVNEDKHGFIYDLNIRRFLGTRGSVNSDILSTCSSLEQSYLFWFLNNGITMVCDRVDPVTDPDNPHIKLKNVQIVNGCQTASTLALAEKQGNLKKDSRVLVKIFQTDNLNLVDKVVLTTNNQNKISGRNLRANEQSQIDLEEIMKHFGYYYERKPRQYHNNKGITADNIFPNDIVAVAYLSIVLKRCSDSRSRKYKVWSEYYDKIFTGRPAQIYIFSTLIYKKVKQELSKTEYAENKNDISRFLYRNATFHLSRIISHKIKGDDNWSNLQNIQKYSDDIKANRYNFHDLINTSVEVLKNTIGKNTSDLNALLKSSNLDTKITTMLNKKVVSI